MNRGRFLALIFLFSSFHSADGAPLLRTVALSGQQASGAPNGVIFGDFEPPDINDDGLVAFQGNLVVGTGGVSPTSDVGNWSEGSGVLELVAREGSQAPGVPVNANFGLLFITPTLNNLGQVSFSANLQTGAGGVVAGNNSGVWVDRAGSLQLFAREGSQAPGVAAGTNFGDSFFPFLHNQVGQVAFAAYLQSAPSGIWSEGSGGLALVAQSGQVAPGTGGGIFTDVYVDNDLVFNNAGAVAFVSRLQEGIAGVDSFNNLTIWSDRTGTLELVARTNDVAPGTSPSETFANFSYLEISDNGGIAFVAITDDGSDQGIWSDTSGDLTLIAHTGQQAPGTPPGALYSNLIDNTYVVLNASGKIAFTGELQVGTGGVTGFNTNGLWSDASGTLELISRAGDVAPGAPSGVHFSQHDLIALNDRGQVAFVAFVDTGYLGLWANDSSGELKLIAMEGADLEVAPGDLRTVETVRFFGNGKSYSGFNNRGQIAFYAAFTDGTSGVFVSNVAAVPEPGTLLLCLISGICATARRRH